MAVDPSWEFHKKSKMILQIKTAKTVFMDENKQLIFLEVKNRSRQVKLKLGHVVKIHLCPLL